MTHTVYRHAAGLSAGLTRGRRRVISIVAAGALAGSLAVVLPTLTGTAAEAAAPTSSTDAARVPHYFGPWPNWALSPLPQSSAEVTVTGDGTGATASANIDPLTGGIASIDVTNPGEGYSTASVTIAGGDGAATATATVTSSGALTGFTVTTPGTGYFGFDVALSGGGANGADPANPATVQGTGSVEAVKIVSGGKDYTAPTVEFDLPDLPNGTQATGHAVKDATGTITEVVVDNAGSGYLTAPAVAIHDGTVMDPIVGATLAKATTTLTLTGIDVVDLGSGYVSAPTVTVSDLGGSGTGAEVTADFPVKGTVSAITVDTPGANFLSGGIKKFQDELPTTCDPANGGCPTSGKYIPIAVPTQATYTNAANNNSTATADQYVIGLVQYRTQFNSDLPPTLARGYVQVETPDLASVSQHVALENELLDGTKVPVLDKDGNQVYGVTPPQWLGPFINATKDKAVRVVFHNYLPTGAGGDLFLPVDSSMMGSGMGPMTMGTPVNDGTVMDEIRNPTCTTTPDDAHCFRQNRSLLHLHGGMTPWISDGTPHQWITPSGETTTWPKGVGVTNVPDMIDTTTNSVICDAADSGCETFYYTNQQSARLMWYHDHSWGITRLNVYVGQAAGYTITDDTEKALVASGTVPGPADTIPLVVQDRTFVPDDSQLKDVVGPDGKVISYGQDPTWDTAAWGSKGSFWYHHVYMPAQNPGDASGMSAYGRWMYGPWFWPPASGTKYGPIKNPYYDAACNVDVPSTWQYQTDPFCEPELIPGTPNLSAGMEQFNDTPLVNGVAYPTTTLQPKSYRLRLLNGANDRFFNLQWYVADSDPANGGTTWNYTKKDGTTVALPSGSEVKLNAAELAAAQTDTTVVPTPVGKNSNAAGPDWVQIANESGFLPAPAVLDGQQPTTWITDPTRFDVGNVDQHSMLLAPAERSDVIVDFSKFAGKTLILYNDAPAAFPARVPSYDYYTGAPDMSPNGAPKILPGYGPNTRTVMQVKIAAETPATAFSLTRLQAAFKHHVDGSGVFESGQNPPIVGQAGYNSALGTSFAGTANCNGGSTSTTCDGLVRVNDTGSFSFNTLKAPTSKMTMRMEPKAIHDEMNSSTFDEYGRMQANLGLEAQPPTPGAQNVTLYPYVNPPTELIDGTDLQAANVKATPISTASDGTQIWRITHNGVDTHPIHFHLFDVQVLNRVTWDNIVIPPDANELGWKDTVRTSPLEDTIVALRPQVPVTPFEVPNSVRPLDPMMPLGDGSMFNNVAPDGTPSAAITNQLVNFGWEYVFHCHILSHEEMDMMRPVSLAVPPLKPAVVKRDLVGTGGARANVITFDDNSITETSFVLQRSGDGGKTWADVTGAGATLVSPLNQVNVHRTGLTLTDTIGTANADWTYRVAALNTVGYGAEYPSLTAKSYSGTVDAPMPPAAPTGVRATAASTGVVVSWTDNGTNETGFVVQRQQQLTTTTWSAWSTVANPAAVTGTGAASWTDATLTAPGTYRYQVAAANAAGQSDFAVSNSVGVARPSAPRSVTATLLTGGQVRVGWLDTSNNELGFVIERSADGGGTWTPAGTLAGSGGTGGRTWTDSPTSNGTYVYRVGATSPLGTVWATPNSLAVTVVLPPAAPNPTVTAVRTSLFSETLNVSWASVPPATGYTVQWSRSSTGGGLGSGSRNLPSTATSTSVTALARVVWYVRVGATNAGGTTYSAWKAVPAAP